MTVISRRTLLAGVAAVPAVLAARAGLADDYPTREVHVICAYAPGTGADLVVRYFAERLRLRAGKPMIVENKPGAGTSIGCEYAAQAKPDGYTLLITPGNGVAGNVYLYKNLRHDPLKDFTPVTTLIKLPFVLVVSATSPVTTVAELIALTRQKGDKTSYGAPTNLALAAGSLFNERLGLQAVAVPYKSTPEALNDLNNGFIDYLWSDATFALGQARQGHMRVLAMTTEERSSLEPSIPTLQESGVPKFNLAAWWGAWFPAHTPQPIVDKVEGWLNAILQEPETKEYFGKTAPADLFQGTAASLQRYLEDDIPRWAEVYKLAKIEPQ